MKTRKRNPAAITAACLALGTFVQQSHAGTYAPIVIDGSFSDWSYVPVAVSTASNGSAVDPVQLKMANDQNNIYFEVTFASSANSYTNGLYLAIDSDNSTATGFDVYTQGTIGSNFSFVNDYPFTQATGVFNSGGTFNNSTYSASPFDVATTTEEIAIPITLSESDSTAGGYSGPVFNTATGSFTVEFYTGTAVLGPYTYSISNVSPLSTYALTGSGDFNQLSSWTTGIPGGVGAEADFLGSLTANHTVYSDVAITLGKIVFNNANTYVLAGAGALTMQASAGNTAVIDAQAGTQKITLPTEIASNTTLQAESGATLIMGAPVTVDSGMSLNTSGAGSVLFQSTITVQTGASMALTSASKAASLTLNGTSTASVNTSPTGSKTALQLSGLSIATGSTFDLKNNDLVVHGGNLATIQSEIASGFNASGMAWSGTGITSSAAAADSTHLTALGVIQDSTASGSAIYSTFDGASVGSGDVLVKYTYYGDANLSGTVDGSDYTLIDNGFNSHLTGWYNGDFNYDGTVDGSDYTLIDNAFNTQGAPIGTSPSAQIASQFGSAAVPEPASIGMLGVSAVLALRARRRR